MKIREWIPYLILGALIIIYFIGEATGLLFFAFLIIAPVWAWIVTEHTLSGIGIPYDIYPMLFIWKLQTPS